MAGSQDGHGDDDAVRALASWEAKGAEWDSWIGREGDRNRRLNSDPVLWRMAGDVRGRDVLDAGCGNGYLAIRMASLGARVTAVDWAPAMVERARRNAEDAGVEVAVIQGSTSRLDGVASGAFDLVVSNYVLMDAPDLEGAAASIARVLRSRGRAVCVMSHPCFDLAPERLDDGRVRYTWERPYLDRYTTDESWGPFATPFVYFHRSLSDYLRCFRDEGLELRELDEPVVVAGTAGITEEGVRSARMTPYSIALALEKA